MAFVFRAENKDPVQVKGQLPGPGQYISHQPYNIEENRIAFHSSIKKDIEKPKYESNPGPGAYNIAKDLLAPEKSQNVFFMPANPDGEADEGGTTNVFRSKAKRFGNTVSNLNPGPGAYHKPQSFGRKMAKSVQNAKSNKLELVQGLIRNGKHMIPSIPGNTHSYGYTENDEHDLVLNQNPLSQAQQYVGPGYYEAKSGFQGSKYKGPAWHKSGVKKIEIFANQPATTETVGPGTYEAEGVNAPNYKNKPHAGFASASTRSFDAHVKQKLAYSKVVSRTPLSSQSEAGGRRTSAAETAADDDDDDEYIKDATPGPGHYHNESYISSFSLRSPNSDFSSTGTRRFPKAVKPPAFGSSQRFKEHQATTKEIGPGDYQVDANLKSLELKYVKVPFQSSNTRFERSNPLLQPGPGTYNPPMNLVDRVKEKGKSGYAGSFGITEKRFKISKLLEDTPGPGAYNQENQKSYVEDITAAFQKGSHFFVSESGRNAFSVSKDVKPSPGSYNLEYFSIANKVLREEDEADLPKRIPFNTGQARFEKPKEKPIPEDDDEDEDDEPRFGTSKNLESLLKSKIKEKPSAVFQSQTKRNIVNQKAALIPGPGAYYDPSSNFWNKRTFNIHFTGE